MKKMICLVTIILICALSIFPSVALADAPLDRILDYQTTVNVRNDGTLDINYLIKWQVLDSLSEGPLEWVKIGIPNEHADTITALTDNIADIGYYNDGGSYVRVDFDRSYYAGEVITFAFSIHQSYMYVLNHDSNICSYAFTVGWFDEIEVEAVTILWNNENVKKSDADSDNGQYLVWKTALGMGEKCRAVVEYELGTFAVDESRQYVEEEKNSSSGSEVFGGIFLLAVIAFVVFMYIRRIIKGGYRGGFGTYFHGGGVGGGHCACASSCACACACACAGGGRAGCSAKNFYRHSIETEKLKEALQKK